MQGIMTDLDELRNLVVQNSQARGQPISKLGYFCTPFRPETGPLSDKVIKIYQSLDDRETLETLCRNHDNYVAVLRRLGIEIPETEIHLLETGKYLVPVIVQEALDTQSLMRDQMIKADLHKALEMMQAAGLVIAGFWNNLDPDMGRVGFHPSIRNFAIEDDRAIFFDSFPPLIHYSHNEMGKILLLFSEKRLIRLIGPLVSRRVASIQDEWYSASETLIGLVGSACRLRPDNRDAFLDWGREFAKSQMSRFSDDIVGGLENPPRLPGYWTGFRKLLGLQGEPNL
jgi:hypothetical protein